MRVLVGKFGARRPFGIHQPGVVGRHYLDEIDHLSATADQLDQWITALLARLEHNKDIANLDTIPGIGPAAAEIIIAETGGDTAQFTAVAGRASFGPVGSPCGGPELCSARAAPGAGEAQLTASGTGGGPWTRSAREDKFEEVDGPHQPIPSRRGPGPAVGAWPEKSAS